MGRPQAEASPVACPYGQPAPETPPPPPTAESNYLQQQRQQPTAACNPPYPPPQPEVYPPTGHPPVNPMENALQFPQVVKFPPEQYTPPPVFHQNAAAAAAAPGIPVQQKPLQYYAPGGMPGRVGPSGTVQWTTGLFDCKDDLMNAVMTFFFPCVTFGQIAEIVDDGRSACSTSGFMYGCVAALIALPCLISCGYRTRLRAKYDLVEAPAPDWATHFLCECCALCQEYRELRNRGLDPAIGWHANMVRIQSVQQGVVMAPPANQIMTG